MSTAVTPKPSPAPRPTARRGVLRQGALSEGASRLGASLRRLKLNEAGNIATMFALMLPVLFGMVGLGVEVGIWFKEKRELQTIADAAAVSAAIENTYGSSSAEITAAAQLEADNNGFDATSDTMSYVGTPTSGTYTGQSGYIEVIITRELDTILSQVFYSLSPSTTVRAVAATSGDQDACVLALSSNAQNSIYVNGAGTSVTMNGCGVVANSNNATKAVNVQNGALSVDCIWTAGGISGEENMTTACDSNVSNAATIDDPYADLTVPAFGTCDVDPNGNTAYSSSDDDDGVLDEGVYCGGLSISAGDTVTLNPGTYIMDEGDFTVNGNATVTGTGVTIILTSSSGSGYGTINITGGGGVNLTAPTAADASYNSDGSLNGILFYQDRDAGTSASLNVNVTGGSEVELGGAMYIPENEVSFSGGNTANSNGCLMLVAQTVSFNGSADIDNNCDMYGGNPVNYGATPGLVE